MEGLLRTFVRSRSPYFSKPLGHGHDRFYYYLVPNIALDLYLIFRVLVNIMNKKELHAYIAGIIDGEAYVGIKRSTWGMRNRPDVHTPTYSERVQIRMNCREILELIKNEFGGSLGTEPRIYQSKSGFKTKKIMSIYRATDKVATTIIKATKPYLIEKAKQADFILKLRKSKESKKARLKGGMKQKRFLSQEVLDEREQLWLDCKALHR